MIVNVGQDNTFPTCFWKWDLIGKLLDLVFGLVHGFGPFDPS